MTAERLKEMVEQELGKQLAALSPEDRDLLVNSVERRKAEAELTASQRLDGLAVRDTGGRPEGLLVAQRDGGVPTRARMAASRSKRASMRSVVDQPTALPDGSFER